MTILLSIPNSLSLFFTLFPYQFAYTNETLSVEHCACVCVYVTCSIFVSRSLINKNQMASAYPCVLAHIAVAKHVNVNYEIFFLFEKINRFLCFIFPAISFAIACVVFLSFYLLITSESAHIWAHDLRFRRSEEVFMFVRLYRSRTLSPSLSLSACVFVFVYHFYFRSAMHKEWYEYT